MEGTLVDVERAHHEGHVAAAFDVGVVVTVEEARRRFAHFIGGPDAVIAREIWEVSDRQASVEEILAAMKKYYQNNVAGMPITLRPGAGRVVSCVVERFAGAAIGSLTPRDQARPLLVRSGLADMIHSARRVLGEDVPRPKPFPDVFLETARRMGIDASDQVVFDDSPHGVEAAVAAGSIAVGVVSCDDPDVVCAIVRAGARRVVHDWRDVDLNGLISSLDDESRRIARICTGG